MDEPSKDVTWRICLLGFGQLRIIPLVLLKTLLLQVMLVNMAYGQTFHGLARLRGWYEVSGTFEQRGQFSPASAPTALPVQLDAQGLSLSATNVTGMTGPLTLRMSKPVTVGLGMVKTITATVSIAPIRIEVPLIGPATLAADENGRYSIQGGGGNGIAVLRGNYSVSDGKETVRGSFDVNLEASGFIWNKLDTRAYPAYLVLEDESPFGFRIPHQEIFTATVGGHPVTLQLDAGFLSAPVLRLAGGVAKEEPAANVRVAGKTPLTFSIRNGTSGPDWVTVRVLTKVRLVRQGSIAGKKHRARRARVRNRFAGLFATGKDVHFPGCPLGPGGAAKLEVLLKGRTFRDNRYRLKSTVMVSSDVQWTKPVIFRASSVVRGER